jgi:thiosulfate dehydrogenase
VPVGEGKKLPGGDGLPSIAPALTGDKVRGQQVYATKCLSCHQLNGEGNRAIPPGIPALWGPKSFSIGASMARPSKSAAFIFNNMPWGLGKTLTHQEAFDVAAYISSKPRPDSPGKELDWPAGGAPGDVPYTTKGHVPSAALLVLPRANPERAIVEAPKSVKEKKK